MPALDTLNMSLTRTVFISSRIDELASSRRAVYRAVHDGGWIPLLYEAESDDFVIAGRPLDDDQSEEEREAHMGPFNWKRGVDRLIDRSDHFIGVYADSMGERKRYFLGLAAIEYELLRFVVRHANRTDLRRFDDDGSIGNCHWARDEVGNLLRIMAQLGGQSGSPVNDAHGYGAVVKNRVAFFTKRYSGDKPISSVLAHAMSQLPKKEFRSERHKSLPKAANLRRTSFLDIYSKVRDQIRVWDGVDLTLPERPSGAPFLIRIVSRENPGTLSLILNLLYYRGHNVLKIYMGSDAPDPRVVVVKAEPHVVRGTPGKLISDLEGTFTASLLTRMKKPSPHPTPPDAYALHVETANLPGQLYRVINCVSVNDASVINVGMLVTIDKRRAKIAVTVDPFLSKEAMADAIAKKGSKEKLILLQRDSIEADLSSQPGIYSARTDHELEWPTRYQTGESEDPSFGDKMAEE